MRNLLAVDTETMLIVERQIPRLLVLSSADKEGCVVDLADGPRAAKAIARLCAVMADPTRELVFHNATFDLEVLIAAGLMQTTVATWVRTGRIHDTMILDQLLRLAEGGEGATRNSPYYHKTYDGTLPRRSLATLTKEFLGRDLDKGAVRTSFESVLSTGALTTEQQAYARADAVATLDLGTVLLARVERFGPELLTEATQIGAGLALSAIGRRGLRLDRDAALATLATETDKKDDAAAILRDAGLLVTVGKKKPRTKLDEKALRAHLGQWAILHGDSPRLTPKGKISLKREDWEQFAEHDEVIGAFVEYKRREKRMSTFLRQWLNAARATGRVRPTYRSLVATGRSACANPNLQQIPKRRGSLRELFVADPGTALWELDYATLELVCIAQVCLTELQQSNLAKAINAGMDVHQILAAQIYHKDPADVTKDERFLAKMGNFGFWGGMGGRTFVNHCWTLARLRVTEDQARVVREAWLEAWPEARAYLAQWRDARWSQRLALPRHYRDRDVDNLLRGWEHPFTPSQITMIIDHILQQAETFHLTPQWVHGPIVRDRLERRQFGPAVADWLRWNAVRTLTGRVRCPVGYSEYHNTKFQGLAADGCKHALLRLWEENFDVCAFIHDSILLQGDENTAERAAAIMIEEMQKVSPNVTVRIQITGPMTRWGDEAPERSVG